MCNFDTVNPDKGPFTSPLKPQVAIAERSSKVWSLLVVNLSQTISMSSFCLGDRNRVFMFHDSTDFSKSNYKVQLESLQQFHYTCIQTDRQTDVSLSPTLMPVPLSWICRSFSPPSFTVTWILVDLASRLQHCGQRAHVRGDKHTLYGENPRLALSHNRRNYYTLRRVVDVTAPRCKQHWILVLKSHLDTQLLLSHNAK